ncbi:hypothetical protein BVX99_00970 [bacterium F16]|nr:hypothetical protein BVX99_00970 [bacterium F16]
MNNQVFEILVNEHHRRVMAYALSLVHNPTIAEDLVQDAFVTAYKKLNFFDPERNFGTWVRGILRLRYLEHLRQTKEVPVEQDYLNRLEQEHQQFDDLEREPGAAMDALRDCIKKLPETMEGIVTTFYINQKSGAEVAEAFELNEATVRKRLQRARVWLKSCIQESLPV